MEFFELDQISQERAKKRGKTWLLEQRSLKNKKSELECFLVKQLSDRKKSNKNHSAQPQLQIKERYLTKI